MSDRHVRQHRATALPVVAAALLSGLLLAGCSDGGVDLGSLGQKVQQGADTARGTVDEIKAKAADAGLDAETAKQVQDATASAGDAITQARSALDTASAASESASTELAAAKAALESSKAQVDALAAKVGGAVGTALSSLADQLDSLAGQLASAG